MSTSLLDLLELLRRRNLRLSIICDMLGCNHLTNTVYNESLLMMLSLSITNFMIPINYTIAIVLSTALLDLLELPRQRKLRTEENSCRSLKPPPELSELAI